MEKRKRLPLPVTASPQEKYDNLILTAFEEWQEHDGHDIDFPKVFRAYSTQYLGFQNHSEFFFYTLSLINDGLFQRSMLTQNVREVSGGPFEVPVELQVSLVVEICSF